MGIKTPPGRGKSPDSLTVKGKLKFTIKNRVSIKNLYNGIRNFKDRILFDLSNIKKGNLKSYFQLKNGFFDSTIKIDGINNSNYKEFLSDRKYYNGHPWNCRFSGIIDNKLYLPYLLNNYKEYLPKTYFYKDKSGYLPVFDGAKIPEFNHKVRLKSKDIIPFLKNQGEIVFKHTHSQTGDGFHLLSYIDDKWYLDNKKFDESNIVYFLENLEEYIIQEKIIQADYASNISHSSVNTIRFQCAWNKNNKTFEIIRAFHRFGSNGQIVDNLGQGNGVLVYLDPQKGIMLKEGVINKGGVKNYIKDSYISHPDNNKIISGIHIPNYLFVRDKIIEISNSISFLRWIGWDVALTNDGFKIIETNSLTTLDTIQQREGLLAVDWIKDIFDKNT